MAKLRIPEHARLGVDLAGSDIDLIEQLVAFRKKRRLSQQVVADRMGVERSTVARFESLTGSHSKNHTMLTARRYAEAVNAFIGHLVVDGEITPEGAAPYSALQHSVRENLARLRATGEEDSRESLPPSQAFSDAAVLDTLESEGVHWTSHQPRRRPEHPWPAATMGKK